MHSLSEGAHCVKWELLCPLMSSYVVFCRHRETTKGFNLQPNCRLIMENENCENRENGALGKEGGGGEMLADNMTPS